MLDFGNIHGEVNPALRASKAREAVRDVEDGLARGAGKLDLSGINAMRRCLRRLRWRSGCRRKRCCRHVGHRRLWHELRWKHLRHSAGRAREFGEAGGHSQDHAAAGTPNTDAVGRLRTRWSRLWRWRWCQRRRRRWLCHLGKESAKGFFLSFWGKIAFGGQRRFFSSSSALSSPFVLIWDVVGVWGNEPKRISYYRGVWFLGKLGSLFSSWEMSTWHSRERILYLLFIHNMRAKLW